LSNLYTPPHATVAYHLPTTLAPYVAENHNQINGIPLNIPCGKQLKAKQYSANGGHQDVEGHNLEDKVGGVGISTPGDFHHKWENWSDRSFKSVSTDQATTKCPREVKHGISRSHASPKYLIRCVSQVFYQILNLIMFL
jgi:hypothetical protein